MQNVNNLWNCYRIDSLAVNETANTYSLTFMKNVSVGSGMNARSTEIGSIAIGNLTTGAAPATRSFFRSSGSSYDPTQDFASYNATNLYGDMCTNTFGATFQGLALSGSSADGFSTMIRPDGSVVLSLSCFYSTSTQNSLTEFRNSALFAVKASGASVALDTSWATNGVLKTFDDHTQCAYAYPMGSIDTSITSNTSSKIFTLVYVQTYPRQTTWTGGGSFTSYNGCNTTMSTTFTTSKMMSLKADGSKMAMADLSSDFGPGRWIIDSSGRWNTITSSPLAQNPTYSLLRLNTKGELDTSNGPNGIKTLTGLPSTVTVNGQSVRMRYSIIGIATTAKGFMFSGFSSTSTMPNQFICNGTPTTYESTSYPYFMTVEDGLVTSYGNGGLGEGVTTQFQTECNSGGTSIAFINSKGQHANLILTKAIGSQKAGIKYVTWEATDGVTSGGDGAGVIGGSAAGRVDKKVYSTKLPTVAQAESALQVITAKQAEDLDIRTSTPKICIALTTSVLLVNPGRCVVRIIDEDTKKVLRTMTTTVKATDVDAGTTLTTDEPIYFKQANVKLSKTALAQVKELAAAAASASRIVVIGHSAALGDVSQYSYAISRNRAEAVKAALIKAGVKAPIEIVALAYNQPEKTAKTEKAQALNRRAEVFIFPK